MTGNNIWKEDEEFEPSFQFSYNEVRVWCASLRRPHWELAKFANLLSADEKTRAERFYFARDCDRYIIGRGLLRTLLGGYLGRSPSTIQFTYGAYGKPALTEKINGRTLEFNLSNSNDMAVYIFNWDQPVGIDIEYIHPMKDMDDFALQFFTPDECALIRSLPPEQKQKTFFKLWTCKEAYLKANGSGLTTPLNQMEVSFTAEETASLIPLNDDPDQPARWHLELFIPAAGYQAALAREQDEKQVVFQQLESRP